MIFMITLMKNLKVIKIRKSNIMNYLKIKNVYVRK